MFFSCHIKLLFQKIFLGGIQIFLMWGELCLFLKKKQDVLCRGQVNTFDWQAGKHKIREMCTFLNSVLFWLIITIDRDKRVLRSSKSIVEKVHHTEPFYNF